jgi:hypothetical protein
MKTSPLGKSTVAVVVRQRRHSDLLLGGSLHVRNESNPARRSSSNAGQKMCPKRKSVHFPIEYSASSSSTSSFDSDDGTPHRGLDNLLQSSDVKRRRYMRRGSKSASMMINAMMHVSNQSNIYGESSSDHDMATMNVIDPPSSDDSSSKSSYSKYSHYPQHHYSPSSRLRSVTHQALPQSPASLFRSSSCNSGSSSSTMTTTQCADDNKNALSLLARALTLSSSLETTIRGDNVVTIQDQDHVVMA